MVLLDDPEAASGDLPDEIRDLRKSADRCRKEAEQVRDKFKELLAFIMNLQTATVEAKSE